MTSFSTMDVHFAFGLIFILDLFSHGISVPVSFSDYYDNAPNQDVENGYQISDDITDSYERYPRNVLPNPNFWDQYRWFTRSSVPSRPRKASRRHYHLFHLTSKHPNAVSYHVIEKPHAATRINSRQQINSNPRRSYLYNNNAGSQYQSYPAQTYNQQPAPNYPGYPTGYGSSTPQNQYGIQTGGGVHDSTYDDILQVVSQPMKIGNKIIPPYHNEDRQNDQTPTSIEEAAKQFKLASADMNNMELASLVIYPIPRFNDHPKVHKKKSNKKHKKHQDKEVKAKEETKVENKGKTVTNLVDNLIKNKDTENRKKLDKDENDDQEIKEEKAKKEKEKVKENDKETKQDESEKNVKDSEDDDETDDKDTATKDSWAEEEITSKDEQQYTSSKRSEIPHAFDEIANSDKDDQTEKSEVSDENKSGNTESNDDSEEDDSNENSDEQSERKEKNDETENDNDEVENNSENKKDDSHKTD